MGRVTDCPKNNVISFRLTDDEFAQVMKRAGKEKLSRGDLARDLVVTGLLWLDFLEAANAEQR